MREPGENEVKAWSREYNEAPFYFEQKEKSGHRIVAWSESPRLTKSAFYKILDEFPLTIEVLLKIEFREAQDSKPLWSRYHGTVDRWRIIDVVQKNEVYVFSDGSHQLCLREPNAKRYLAFDEHGIFFLYSPKSEDAEIFRTLGFERRYAEPIFSKPHFTHIPPDPEKLEMKFVTELQLLKVHSDLD